MNPFPQTFSSMPMLPWKQSYIKSGNAKSAFTEQRDISANEPFIQSSSVRHYALFIGGSS